MQRRILVASSMNGGAEAVAPVALKLREQGNKVCVISYRAATATFRSMGVEPDILLTSANPLDCSTEFRIFGPDRVVTGTQVQDKEQPNTLEQQLLDLGKRGGVRTVTVLDTWGNYVERFSDLDVNGPEPMRILRPLVTLPDKIAVMDDYAKTEMLKLGFQPGLIAITGNPHFEYVLGQFERLSPATRSEVLAKPVFAAMGFREEAKTVVFMSDSMASYPDLGFTEKSVLQSFLKIMNELARKTGITFNLIVRPHPFRNQDAGEAFDFETPLIRKVLHNPVSARGLEPQNNYTMEQLLATADLVVGTFNNPLITAKIIGKPVINYVPGIDPKYDFQTFLSEQGLTTRITEEAGLGDAILGLLDGTILQKTIKTVRGSTDAVIELLK